MNRIHKQLNGYLALVLLGATMAIGVNSSRAATVTKAATGTDLNAGASWGGTAPTSSDIATWDSTSLGAGLTLGTSAGWSGISISGALTDIGITGAGTLTLGAGGIDMSASTVNLNSLATPVALGASQTWSVNSAKTLTCSGVISGTGKALTKSGVGTLTLSGANTYSGGTTISAGTVQPGSATALGTGTVTLGDANTGSSAASLLATWAGGGRGTKITNPIVVSASGTGPVTIGSVGALTIGLFWGGQLTLNRDVIITNSSAGFQQCFTGAITGTGNVTFAGSGFRTTLEGISTFVGNVTVATTGGCYLQVGGVQAAGQYIPATAAVTVNAGAYMRMACDGDTIDALNGAGNVDVNSKNCVLTVGGNNGSGAFSGILANSGSFHLGLTKTGTGTQILSGVNTYTNTTAVNGGTLLVNSPGSLANTPVTVASGATLGGSGTVNGTVNASAGGILSPGASANTIGTLTLANNTASSLTLNGNSLLMDLSNVAGTCDLLAISGASGALVLNGANTITLSTPLGTAPAGTYTLMTYASKTGSGTLALDHTYPNASLTVGPTSVTLTVTGAGTFGGYYWRGDGTANVWDIGTTANWAASGSGVTLMTYADSFAPVFFDDTGSNTPAINITAPVSPINVTVSSSNNYTIGGSAITGTAGLTKAGTGTLTLNGANTYTGNTIISGGKLTLGSASALPVASPVSLSGVLDLNNYTPTIGLLTGSGQLLNIGSTLTISATTSGTFSGVVPNNVGGTSVVKTGSGAQTFGGANTYTGGTLISGGNLGITTSTALGTGNVTLAGGSLTIGASMTNTIILNSAANTIAASSFYWTMGPITGTGDLTFSAVSNPSGLLLTNNGNSFLGNVTISGGGMILRVVGNNAFPSTAIVTNDGSNLRLDVVGGGINTVAGLTGNGSVYVPVSQTSLQLLRVGAGGVSSAFAGAFGTPGQAANLALEKIDAGTFTLSGANLYQGATTVSGGTLLVNGSVTASSGVTVAATATLGGTGTISAPITVQSGGTLAPGASIGTLTVNNTLTLAAGSTTTMEIKRAPGPTLTSDQIAGATSVSAAGGLTVTLDGSSDPLVGGESFTLFNVQPSGTFSPVTLPSPLASGLNWFTADNYQTLVVNRAPTGSDIVTSVSQGRSITNLIIGGKYAPSDLDGDTLTITSVSTPSLGTATIDGPRIIYTSTGGLGADSFTYTVSDGRGGSVTKTVSVTVLGGNGANIISLTGTVPNITVNFAGIPSSTYAIERSPAANGPWTEIAPSVVTGANGLGSHLDTSAPSPTGYYRTRYVSTP